ncbi:MAG: archaellin/type IV pilin N-terminal domain-containing protein [Halarchaeum sp.]
MFETDEDRGQVGIGTLIVFIAMVLVAAIAAGVLINTAGFLQTKSEQTGQQSASQVTNQIQVNAKTGTVGQSDAQYLTFETQDHPTVKQGETVTIQRIAGSADTNGTTITDGTNTVQISDGTTLYVLVNSDTAYFSTNATYESGADVAVSGATITDSADAAEYDFQFVVNNDASAVYTDDDGSSNTLKAKDLSLDSKAVVTDVQLAVMRGAGSSDINLEQATIQVIGPDGSPSLTYGGNGQESVSENSEFGLEPINDVGGTLPVLSSSEDRFKLLLDVGDLESGDTVTLKVSTESGATTTTELTVPESLVDKEAVRL